MNGEVWINEETWVLSWVDVSEVDDSGKWAQLCVLFTCTSDLHEVEVWDDAKEEEEIKGKDWLLLSLTFFTYLYLPIYLPVTKIETHCCTS